MNIDCLMTDIIISKHDQEIGRLRAEIDKVESARARLQLDQERAQTDVGLVQVIYFFLIKNLYENLSDGYYFVLFSIIKKYSFALKLL
jgi:hypothetical protein